MIAEKLNGKKDSKEINFFHSQKTYRPVRQTSIFKMSTTITKKEVLF